MCLLGVICVIATCVRRVLQSSSVSPIGRFWTEQLYWCFLGLSFELRIWKLRIIVEGSLNSNPTIWRVEKQMKSR